MSLLKKLTSWWRRMIPSMMIERPPKKRSGTARLSSPPIRILITTLAWSRHRKGSDPASKWKLSFISSLRYRLMASPLSLRRLLLPRRRKRGRKLWVPTKLWVRTLMSKVKVNNRLSKLLEVPKTKRLWRKKLSSSRERSASWRKNWSWRLLTRNTATLRSTQWR